MIRLRRGFLRFALANHPACCRFSAPAFNQSSTRQPRSTMATCVTTPVRREEAEVRVLLARPRVVVAGADVDVPPEPSALSPNHQRHLRVILEADDAAHDVAARGLEGPRPRDVDLLGAYDVFPKRQQ